MDYIRQMSINNKIKKQKNKIDEKHILINCENDLINEATNNPYIKTRFSVSEGFEEKDFMNLLKMLLSKKKISAAKQLIIVDIRKGDHESYNPVVEMHGTPIDPYRYLSDELNKRGTALNQKYDISAQFNFITLLNSSFKNTQEIVTKAGAIYFKPGEQSQKTSELQISTTEELISSLKPKSLSWLHFIV